MKEALPEHTLEFLLAFDGRKHHYPDGYSVKFEIKRVEPSPARPHGLRYSFTLHGPDGTRLVGFDNAHAVSPLIGIERRTTWDGPMNSSAPNNWSTTFSTRWSGFWASMGSNWLSWQPRKGRRRDRVQDSEP